MVRKHIADFHVSAYDKITGRKRTMGDRLVSNFAIRKAIKLFRENDPAPQEATEFFDEVFKEVTPRFANDLKKAKNEGFFDL